jgi:hypothetical protein
MVTVCVLSGLGHLASPKDTLQLMLTSYSKSYAKVKEYGVPLPITPELLSLYGIEINMLLGALLLLGSILTIFNVRFGPCILSSLLVLFTVTVHNPCFYQKEKEAQSHVYNGLLNLGMVSCLWLVCGSRPSPKKKTD